MRPSIVAIIVLLANTARAAEFTEVADAADEVQYGDTTVSNPFDLWIASEWIPTWSHGSIEREAINRPGFTAPGCAEGSPRGCAPVKELSWKRQVLEQEIGAQVGIFHDLALTFELPIVYYDNLHFDYAPGVSAASSTVDTGNAGTTLFAHNYAAYRAGLGPMGVGLRWGILSEVRDESKPNWVLLFKWLTPTTTHTVRFVDTSPAHPGGVGDGMNWLTAGMAFSKRLANFGLFESEVEHKRHGWAEPYLELSYSYPIPAGGFALSPYTSQAGDFKALPSQIGRLNLGVELIPYEELMAERQLVIDLGIRLAYMSEGRNYSILADPLGRLTYSQEYVSAALTASLIARPWSFVKIRVGVAVGWVSDHILTDEMVGIDKNGDGQIIPPSQDPNPIKDEINPYYCGNDPADVCSQGNLPSYDAPGSRFIEAGHIDTTAYFGLIFLI